MIFAAAPWTQHIAPVLVAASVVLLIALGIGYLIKVESPKHPKK